MDNQIEKGWKTSEGQLTAAVLSGLGLVVNKLTDSLITNLDSSRIINNLPIDEILKKAETVQDIVIAYNDFSGSQNIANGINFASIMGIIAFGLTVYLKYINNRNELKSDISGRINENKEVTNE